MEHGTNKLVGKNGTTNSEKYIIKHVTLPVTFQLKTDAALSKSHLGLLD
jgi:hypothetical protein